MYYLGIGVTTDYDKAFDWISLAANQDYLFAQHNLAEMYETGKGASQDYNKAYEYYITAARRGYLESQIKVAEMYKEGIGTEKDLGKSAYWLKQIAESKNSSK